MDRRKFVFAIFQIDQEGGPIRHLGNAFPITPRGDLLTCKHVATPRDESGGLQPIEQALGEKHGEEEAEEHEEQEEAD
jgi:hypothetical protein